MTSASAQKPFLYSVERQYEYPVERVWQAWVDPVELEAWYHPTDLENVPHSVVSEPILGGWWTVAVDASPYGFISYFWGNYTAITQHVRLEHTMFYSQDESEFLARDTSQEHDIIVIDFSSDTDKTHVRFSQHGSLAKDQIPLAQAGMESYFQSLQDFLETYNSR